MRPQMMRSRWAIMLSVLIGAALAGWAITLLTQPLMDRATAMTKRTAFGQPPVFIGMQTVARREGLKPFALALRGEKLLVSYLSSDRIDEFSGKLELQRTLHLLPDEPASITGLATARDRIYATNFNSGDLLVVDYKSGKVLQSFGWRPDYKARIKALGVTYHQDNLYVSDVASNQMLVISSMADPVLRDEGELLLHFPNSKPNEFKLGYPTGSMVTPDGRLLVSDATAHEVKAFTCNGRSAHLFDKEGAAAMETPMGIAMDDLSSPVLKANSAKVFDTSGVNEQGRIHVVDATQARVKVFNALGQYVLTYGKELQQPNAIAIDQKRRLIFISDAKLQAIALYKY